MIKFTEPTYMKNFNDYFNQVIINKKYCGDGPLTKEAELILQEYAVVNKILFTSSCTHSLELTSLLLDLQVGDEVIMPSYTFVSTANAFALRGCNIKFIDINPLTMNIDEKLIEAAITPKTKVIVPVHYAGVGCEMDDIINIAKIYKLSIVEDSAQGIGAKYKGKELGTFGDLGCVSFHETKNIQCGEGGALYINNQEYIHRAEIIREKGTNRSQFIRGQVDKYTWVDIGSSYLLGEINLSILLPQLKEIDIINKFRLSLWNRYLENLSEVIKKYNLSLPNIPRYCNHNAHMFYIKVANNSIRNRLIEFLKEMGVIATFHYIPLHSTKMGDKYGSFVGKDKYTTIESEKIIRLPLHNQLKTEDVDYICELINSFMKKYAN